MKGAYASFRQQEASSVSALYPTARLWRFPARPSFLQMHRALPR